MEHPALPSFLEAKPCDVCGGTQFDRVVAYRAGEFDHGRYDTASWDGRQAIPLAIERCRACALVMARPSFREEYLHLVYPEDLVPRPTDARVDAIFDPRTRKFHAMARAIARRLHRGATVVDVGARYGVFAWILREQYGYDAHGIEMNAASVALGRRRFPHLHEGSVPSLPALLASASVPHVDAFVLDDVLEHLVRPSKDLAVLASLQRRGDRLFLRQMDHDALGRRCFGRRWYYYAPAAHMYYFDERSIGRLLDGAGYEIEAIERTPALANLVRTMAIELPRQLGRNLKGRLPRAKKASYLTRRFKAYDDMFLVVARKR